MSMYFEFKNYLERQLDTLDGVGGVGGLPSLVGVPAGSVLGVVQNPVDENAVLTIRPFAEPGTNPSGGDWTLTFDGDTTAVMTGITWDAVADIQVPLEALPSIGAGNVTASGSIGGLLAGGEVVLTFIGALGNQPIAADRLTVDGTNLTGDSAPYAPVVEQTALGAVGGEKLVGWVADV